MGKKYKYNIKKGDKIIRIVEGYDAQNAFDVFCALHKDPEEYSRGWTLKQYDAGTHGGECACYVLDMGSYYDVIDVVLRDGQEFTGREYPSY